MNCNSDVPVVWSDQLLADSPRMTLVYVLKCSALTAVNTEGFPEHTNCVLTARDRVSLRLMEVLSSQDLFSEGGGLVCVAAPPNPKTSQ